MLQFFLLKKKIATIKVQFVSFFHQPATNTHVHSKQVFPLVKTPAPIQERSAFREPEALGM